MIMRYTCDPFEARGKIRFLLYPAPGFTLVLKESRSLRSPGASLAIHHVCPFKTVGRAGKHLPRLLCIVLSQSGFFIVSQ